MISSREFIPSKTAPAGDEPPLGGLPNWRALGLGGAVLVLCFGLPLYQLVRFALGSDLYSHIPLIPLVSAYFAWINRHEIPRIFSPDRTRAVSLGLAGVAAVAGFWAAGWSGIVLAPEDRHCLLALGFVLLLASLCCAFLGKQVVRALAFPLGFLVFMVPMPLWLHGIVETGLQYGSAEVAYLFFKIVGTPVFKQDLYFQLPGFDMQVAPECSGIHSSLALLITSIAAGKLFLRSMRKRVWLALAVIPLAYLRNGFRVFTIGELCVHVSPDMINSYIHKQGGPIFFALSLIPFSMVLYFLYRSERAPRRATPNPA